MKTLKRISAFLGILISSLGFSAVALSEPLTAQQVAGFIAGMPELTALGDKYDSNTQRNIDPSRPLVSSLELMDRKAPEFVELSQLAERHGFSDAEELADVGDRVIRAYPYASVTMSADEIESLYQQGVANINKDPKLKPDQKKLILTRMAASHQRNAEARKASEKDLPALRAHISDLDQLFK